MKKMKISPSLLASDFSRLGEQANEMERCCADMLHLDVMDGTFVPNITFGPPVIKAIKKCTAIPFDVHLMISEPLRYIDEFAKAGADIITFHVEAGSAIDETIQRIKENNCVAALSVKPDTDIKEVFPYLEKLGMVLVMTVEPGFGGQSFMPNMLDKISLLESECRRRNLDVDIQVDGGINEKTIACVAKAGANVFVAGSAVFDSENPASVICNLRKAAEKEQTTEKE